MTTTIDTGLTKSERTDVARELTKVLADSYAVYLKTHGYHWNVRGPEFFALHTLLETQYREIWEAPAMLKELMTDHETLIATARAALKSADSAGDDVSVDLLTARLAAHEKAAWMLRSTLGSR